MSFLPRLSLPPVRLALTAGALCAAALAGACSDHSSGPVTVSVIGVRDDFAKPLEQLPDPGAKLMLEATAQGLVAFDAGGEILPALAQRWIVQDDGKSYIFRLRRAFWPDGERVMAKEVARLLSARIDRLRRMDPNGPLDAVEAVVAMTGEVVEIRLTVPRPFLLQMLAQPQMAILSSVGGTGPYRSEKWGKALLLKPLDKAEEAHEAEVAIPAWQTRILRAERAALAIVRFREGGTELVLGGRYADLPLLVPSGVDRDAVRVDPVQGLLGLAITGEGALLDDGSIRRAINMSIDRNQLPTMFPLGGWATSEQLLPGQFELPAPAAPPPWSALPIEERRAQGRAVVDRWRAEHGDPPVLRIALPDGAGSTMLFALVAQGLRAIGLAAERVAVKQDADLRLIDEVAAYDSALWYLGRIGCARGIHCSKEAEAMLQSASLATTAEERAARIAQAVALMQAHDGYVPLGAPVRWSLVARRLTGFTPSPRARHPLNHLFRATN
ncbi:peptide/nickel transport system substrate-binding protein [Sphingobium faniae]|nr:peptide/nickel transport system substrate-binding protein [Sphingobium faniae]